MVFIVAAKGAAVVVVVVVVVEVEVVVAPAPGDAGLPKAAPLNPPPTPLLVLPNGTPLIEAAAGTPKEVAVVPNVEGTPHPPEDDVPKPKPVVPVVVGFITLFAVVVDPAVGSTVLVVGPPKLEPKACAGGGMVLNVVDDSGWGAKVPALFLLPPKGGGGEASHLLLSRG